DRSCPISSSAPPFGASGRVVEESLLRFLFSAGCPRHGVCAWVLGFLCNATRPLNLRVPHPSRSLRRVGSYDRMPRPSYPRVSSSSVYPLGGSFLSPQFSLSFTLLPLCPLCSSLCERRLPRPGRGVTVLLCFPLAFSLN